MNAKETGKRYNKIAEWWNNQMLGSEYGLNFLKKAMVISKKRGDVLDIGCGCNSRIIELALKNNFKVTGIDVSSEMIRIARERFPGIIFINDDFSE